MIMRQLLYKSVRESKWLFLGCAAAIFAFCWLRVWIVSRLSTERFRAILELLPGDWRRFLTIDFEWLITYHGRISLAYQELIVLLCVAVWSIARGSDVVSGEINRGTMEMLLAQPFSRGKILATQSFVALLGVAVLAFSAWSGTFAGVLSTAVKEPVTTKLQLPLYIPGIGTELELPLPTTKTVRVPMRQKVDMRVFLPATFNLFSLGVMISGLSTLMSSWDRYRWRTIGLVSGILIVQLLLKIAGMALEEWHWLTYLSILSAYEPESHARLADISPQLLTAFTLVGDDGRFTGFGPLAHNLLLLGVGSVSYISSFVIFSRRDLPAPL
jgi:ABC-2 type transport system permease protein